jgi:protein SCO1/2
VSGVARPKNLVAAVVLALSLAISLSGCGGDDPKPGKLNGSVVDPPFEVAKDALVDTDGDPFSLTADTHKRLTLVFFGYTNCPDVCSIVMSTLASAMTRLDDADRKQVAVVFVSTDPARDTPEVLRRYLDRFDKSFIGLTDPPEDIDTIAAVALSVGVGMGDKIEATGGYDPTSHTTTVTGIDSGDEAPVYWGQSTSSAQYAQDIHTLLGDT